MKSSVIVLCFFMYLANAQLTLPEQLETPSNLIQKNGLPIPMGGLLKQQRKTVRPTAVIKTTGHGKHQEGTRVGDIMYTPPQFNPQFGNGIERSRRSVKKVTDRLWPNGTIYYSVDVKSCQLQGMKAAITCSIIKQEVKHAMKVWEEKTCIQFKEGKESSRVSITIHKQGCYSNIGRIGGKQSLNLNSKCFRNTIQRALGHSIGLLAYENDPKKGVNKTMQVVNTQVVSVADQDYQAVQQAYNCPGVNDN